MLLGDLARHRAASPPAYDFCLMLDVFNLLDARGAISVAERQRFIRRVRLLAKGSAEAYLAERERLGFPLLKEAARG